MDGAVDELGKELSVVVIFVAIEALRGTIFALVMWRFFMLNIYESYRDIIRSFGVLLLLYISCFLNVVMCYYRFNYFYNIERGV